MTAHEVMKSTLEQIAATTMERHTRHFARETLALIKMMEERDRQLPPPPTLTGAFKLEDVRGVVVDKGGIPIP